MNQIDNKIFLDSLFKILKESDIQYCVLHSYNLLPYEQKGDVDVCIDRSGYLILDSIVARHSTNHDFKIAQKLYYDVPFCYYYVLVKDDRSDLKLVCLDFLNDNIGINRYRLTSYDLLNGRKKFRYFYIPEISKATTYLLIKRLVKGTLSDKDRSELKYLYESSPQQVDNEFTKYFGKSNSTMIKDMILTDKHIDTAKIIELKRIFLKRNFNIPRFMRRNLFEIRRILYRIRYPTGMLITILSPDGGGKSSVSKEVLDKLLGLFRATKYIHWRPGLLPQLRALFNRTEGEVSPYVTRPHSVGNQNRIVSFLRWVYYSLDFIVGYYLKLLPMKIQTTAIMMDRYYYDIIIDPMRYGFNLPNWLLKIILPIIPKPDLSIFLDNSPEVLHTRKHELPLDELERQVKSWRRFLHRLPNVCIVTTNKPIDEVVNEVTKIILNKRAEMTRKMLKIGPEEAAYIWKSELSNSYVALPSKKNCRWLIPTNPILAKKAWDLYLPYSFLGKFYKNAFRLSLSIGFFAQNRLTPETTEVSEKLRNCIEDTLERSDFALAISTGTPSPFRKIAAMIISSDGTILGCVKIGSTLRAIERIKHEVSILKRLTFNGQKFDTKLRVPQCLFDGEFDNAYFLIESPPPFSGKSGDYRFNKYYADILDIIIKNRTAKHKFIESQFHKELKNGIHHYPLSFRGLLLSSLENLEKRIGNHEVIFALSHGDFVPWNILWNGNEAFMFDWESACLEAPIGIDLVHFLSQTGLLLKKMRGKALNEYITNEKPYEILRGRLELDLMNQEDLLLCYLLKMAIDEDKEQLLSKSAVERRNLIAHIIQERTQVEVCV